MIYCVEDEDSIRNLMTYALEASGFTAKGFPDSVEFFKAVAEKNRTWCFLILCYPERMDWKFSVPSAQTRLRRRYPSLWPPHGVRNSTK